MTILVYVTWNIDPEIFRIGGFALRYYSVLFVLAFISGYWIMSYIFQKEKIPVESLNKFFIYVFLGTLIGARLGHTLFYEFGYFKYHLLEIIFPFRISAEKGFEFTGYQGLASHGGAIGILIAVALSGFFIRMGNLFNSEIIGRPTTVPWAFIFTKVDLIPRHPVQLYEAILYL
jgi:phosphatidylglycerol---prolipoprotein diacylglyceryl transferase